MENRKHLKWEQWIKKLNLLDHQKATRKFYAEMRGNNTEDELFGPIKNEKGKLSTTLEECLENWRSYYKNLYRQPEDKERKDNDCEEIEDELNELNEKQDETLDKDIRIEEIVEAAYALKTNTAAGCDSILSNDILEVMDTSKQDERWKTVEVTIFIHRMMKRWWKAEKVPEKLKEIVIRPFLKKADKDPTKPCNYRPVALLNVLMKYTST